nr:Chain E, CCV-NGY9 peptide from Spike protein [Canine coronavirus]7DC6_F Chain F, CCV-NGY9 peptide from Spike protein [Canine coronavirus]
NGYNFFSTF